MKYTVVIPTRDRVDTLEWSLKTCLCQDYDNFEIIVSDNASQDRTADLVKSFSDKRVKYINTGKRIGMSQNWEFALDHVTDGYVFFMGDDDGLLPDAIKSVDLLLSKCAYDAIAWKKAFYAWPNHVDKNTQNYLATPLFGAVEVKNSKVILERICNFDPSLGVAPYEHLPGLYNSFVSISAINKARGKKGRFFCSQIPDVYSAIALTSSIDGYVYSNIPFSINGASGHSNGTSYFKDPVNVASAKFLSEENIPFHADLLLAPSMQIIVLESVLQARDNVEGCGEYRVNLERFLNEALENSAYFSDGQRRLIEVSLKHLCQVRGCQIPLSTHKFSDKVLAMVRRNHVFITKQCNTLLFEYGKFVSTEEVSNVFEASLKLQSIKESNRIWMILSSLFFKLKRRIF